MVSPIMIILAPTLLTFLGLYFFHSIPITMLLSYGFMVAVILSQPSVNKQTSPASYRRLTPRSSFKPVWIGLLLGILYGSLLYGLSYFFHPVLWDSVKVRLFLEHWQLKGGFIIPFCLIFIFINPFLEEYYWRNYIFGSLLPRTGLTAAALINSLGYCLYHGIVFYQLTSLFWMAIFTLVVFLAGIIWSLLKNTYRSLTLLFLSHWMADIALIAIYLKFILHW
jgi:membrane protease YdiL (CAAX protease family)